MKVIIECNSIMNLDGNVCKTTPDQSKQIIKQLEFVIKNMRLDNGEVIDSNHKILVIEE